MFSGLNRPINCRFACCFLIRKLRGLPSADAETGGQGGYFSRAVPDDFGTIATRAGAGGGHDGRAGRQPGLPLGRNPRPTASGSSTCADWRGGALVAGARALIGWGDGGWINVAAAGGNDGRPAALTLDYRYRRNGGAWEDVRQTVLAWTPCTYGGARPWFRCPTCGRRCCGGAGHFFLCRGCHGLAYQSTREGRRDRRRIRAQTIRRRLGDSPSTSPFPSKPPRMHWRTYMRLYMARSLPSSPTMWRRCKASSDWGLAPAHRAAQKRTPCETKTAQPGDLADTLDRLLDA